MFSNLEPPNDKFRASLLGGSWVVISRVISPLIGVISIVTLLITPLIPTHEPPSSRDSIRVPVGSGSEKHTFWIPC